MTRSRDHVNGWFGHLKLIASFGASPLNQKQHQRISAIAAFCVHSLIAIALFVLISTPAIFIGLVVEYVVIPLNLTPIFLNVLVGTKNGIMFVDMLLLACFMLRMQLAAIEKPVMLIRDFKGLLNEAHVAVREFIFPIAWTWRKFRRLINIMGAANPVRIARLQHVVIALLATSGVAINASINHADRFAVRTDRDGSRVSQLIGPDGAVINVVDSALITIPTWWYGKSVQLQMSNGRTQVVKFNEGGISTILTRVG
jgi:hypothetical protein